MQLADSWSFSSMAICGAGGDTEEELATEKIATHVAIFSVIKLF